MEEFEKLFSDSSVCSENALCTGCTVLEKNKPVHSVMDYEDLPSAEVLFLSDSIKYRYGQATAFHKQEVKDVFGKVCSFMPKDSYVFAAAVKCPDVREADMSPPNMELCREHLADTIRRVDPKLIFTCGNLAMKMLIKKSGITNKRGSTFTYAVDEKEYIVVPIFHPYSVLKEPRNKYLFELDIRNAHEKYIQEKVSTGNFEYTLVDSFAELEKYNHLLTTDEPIALDIETTGLNFRTDKIMTVGISYSDGNIVLPIHHKDTPLDRGEVLAFLKWLSALMSNQNNKKIMHNSHFDCKFLVNYGIKCVNVWDTKVMAHLVNENIPKGLKDLVKIYFAKELEVL